MKKAFDMALTLLPPSVRLFARRLTQAETERAEELRLRSGQAPTVLLPEGEVPLPGAGLISPGEISAVLEIATGASLHTVADSIRRGFVNVRGGVRVGVCGTAVTDRGRITSLRAFSSVSIRIPGEAWGCAQEIFPRLAAEGFPSTLIVSPPGWGKTTLLRELIRLLSGEGLRISLADERGEVAAQWNGVSQLDVGSHTDVITGAPKAEAAMMLLRAMNPQILAMDEITAPEDVEACRRAAGCGVAILATAHGEDVKCLAGRELYRRLLEEGIFTRAVSISKTPEGERRYSLVQLC